jgi:enoyl-CoA hydratase/carnithine racemase
VSTSYECLLVEEIPGGRIIRLNRPQHRNAMSNQMIDELAEAVTIAAADPEVSSIVIAGSPECFSSGGDLSEAVSMDGAGFRAWNARFCRVSEAIEAAPKPVIAAIDGYCFTGGLELAIVCDLRFAAESATFAITSARIGSVAGFGGTQRLPRLVGPARAKRMLFRAEPMGAQEAYDIGLVDLVVPADKLLEAVEAEIALYATRGPISLAMAKRAVDLGLRGDLPSGLRIEADIVTDVFDSEDKREGMSAFLEKRAPQFRGR